MPIGCPVDPLGEDKVFWGKRELHLIPERQLKKLVFGLQPCDEVVDDDEVKGKKGTAPDVDDLQAGEGKEGQLVHLSDEKLKKKTLPQANCH